jgi:hypothetical protein
MNQILSIILFIVAITVQATAQDNSLFQKGEKAANI